jgi:hypothetical protein
MFRNRMLGGVSFLPLFAPEGAAGGAEVDPAEVAAHGDPEFADAPAGAAAADGAEGEAGGGEAEASEGAAAAAAGDAAAGEGEGAEKAGDPADVEQLQKTVKALTKRLGTVAAEKRDLSKKLQETIAAVPKAGAEPPAAAAGEGEQPQRADFKTQAEFDAAVRAEARRVAAHDRAVEQWNDKCNAVEDAGSKAYKDKWAAAKANLGVLDDQGQIPADLLATALETDNPAQVIFQLGSNLDRAAELMAMTPAKRAIAMDRMAQVKAPERQRSQAPAPIDPITGRGGGNDAPSDRDSDAEWHRKEALREAERRKKRLGLAS